MIMNDTATPSGMAPGGASDVGAAGAVRPDPLKPQHLDRDLNQQTADMFQKAKEKEGEQKQAEQARLAAEEIEKIKNLGFVTLKDSQEAFAKQASQIEEAWKQINQIKSFLKATAPSQNSGVLDSPRVETPNPLLDYWRQKK